MDFPVDRPPPVSVHTFGPTAAWANVTVVYTTPTNGAWVGANTGLFTPFYLDEPMPVTKMFVNVAANGSANADLGVYTLGGARLCSTGSFALTGTNTLNVVAVTPTLLTPGTYYMAAVLTNTTATLLRSVTSTIYPAAYGLRSATNVFPLPDTVTFTGVGFNYFPLIGVANGVIL